MSSRWYPIYQKGGPQLRVFLPNFWMKMVRPQYKQPPNIVQFITSIQMTDYDIKNYLEKIYKIPVAHVRSEIVEGELKRVPRRGYVVKDDDFRRAFVTLAGDEKFEFPDVVTKKTEQEESDYKKLQSQTEENYERYQERNKSHSNLPGWFPL
ncbi:large ribosomal subunit protein uL23m [Halyomorpha halys]|uniref:large ribosomal subunit protein uL23m n=1 Tax=Halyomorpha halys TaxID=286706 RepID=UPI0006D4E32A|nr:39S ribosomal protein L23, mitochondrial [Halyomorpha halys]